MQGDHVHQLINYCDTTPCGLWDVNANMQFVLIFFIILHVNLEYLLAVPLALFPTVCIQHHLATWAATLTQTRDFSGKGNVVSQPWWQWRAVEIVTLVSIRSALLHVYIYTLRARSLWGNLASDHMRCFLLSWSINTAAVLRNSNNEGVSPYLGECIYRR